MNRISRTALAAAIAASCFMLESKSIAQVTADGSGAEATASDIIANGNAAAAAFDAAHPSAEPTASDLAIAGLWSLTDRLRQENQIDDANALVGAIGTVTNTGATNGDSGSKAVGTPR